MKTFTCCLVFIFSMLCPKTLLAQCKLDKSNYQLVFEDNFDTYTNISQLATNWSYQPSTSKPYNGFGSEYYNENQISLQPNGILRLTATRVAPFVDPDDITKTRILHFKSGKLESKVYPDPGTWENNPGGFTYGMFEIRCKLPTDDNGTWPTFWLYSGPTEIDVIDNLVPNPAKTIYSVIHDWTSGHKSCAALATKQVGTADLAAEFNIYTVAWTPDKVTFFLNGREWRTVTSNQMATHPHPATIIASLQMERWSSVNLAQMDIDYIRVYKPRGYVTGGGNPGDYSLAYKSSNESINHDVTAASGSSQLVNQEFGSLAVNPNNPEETFYRSVFNQLYSATRDANNRWIVQPLPYSGNSGELVSGNVTFNEHFGIIPYRGNDGRIQCYGRWQGWYHAYVDENWSTQDYLVKNAAGSISNAPNGDIFYIGADSKIQRFFHTSSGWSHEWLPFNYGNPTLGYPNGDYAEGDIVVKGTTVFYKGFDRRLQYFYTDGAGAYQHAWADSNWSTDAYTVSAKPGSIVSGNQSDVLYIGTDNRMHLFNYQNSSWQHTLLPHTYGNPSLGYANADYVKGNLSWDNAHERVVYAGYDGRIQCFSYNNGAWGHNWVDDYWNTNEFASFNSYQNIAYSASLSTNAVGTTFYCDQNNHLRYFKYEACENTDPPCDSPTPIGLLRPAKEPVVALSKKQQRNDKLLVYPNPTQTKITIELPNSLNIAVPGKWILYTSTGSQAQTAELNSTKFSLDLSSLPQGIYLLEILVDKAEFTQRIVKE